MLNDFDEKMAEEVKKKHEMEQECQTLRTSIASFCQQELDLKEQIGKLQAQKEAHEKVLMDRVKTMEKVAHNYNIMLGTSQTQSSQQGTLSHLTGTRDTAGSEIETILENSSQGSLAPIITEDEMNSFMHALDSKEQELQEQLDHLMKESRASEDQLGKTIGDLIGREKSIENGVFGAFCACICSARVELERTTLTCLCCGFGGVSSFKIFTRTRVNG